MSCQSRPTCSIIIPTRDCLDYLPIALHSIDMQRIEGLEVIVIDDGSRDGTAEWLAAAPRVGAELRLLSTDGIGVARARNKAIEAARSDLVAFLDADDYWWPGKLARQLAFHEAKPDIGLSFTDYVHVTPDGRTHGTCFEFWRCDWGGRQGTFDIVPDAEWRLLATNVVGTSAVVARRDVLERVSGFSVACKSAEDWDLWLRMAAVASVACSHLVAMTYLMRPNGETSARSRRIEAMADIVARYASRSEPAMRSAVRRAEARLATARAEMLSAEGRAGAAAAAYLKALFAAPSGRALKAALAGSFEAASRFGAAGRRAA
ncbi:MAG: glycosyltransferase family 2 protein [Hyphomicrobiaceae bacterium]